MALLLTESSLVSSPKCVLGVDPGMSGAVFKIGCGSFDVWRDFKSLTEIGNSIRDFCQSAPALNLALIEHVHAMPKQGVCSTFTFGEATGAAKVSLGLFLAPGVPLDDVEPQEWQGFFRQRLGMTRKQEFDSRAIASNLFPSYKDFFSRVKDHNSADACLIAVWGLSKLQNN